MKRKDAQSAIIEANDGNGHSVSVTVAFVSSNALERSEVSTVCTKLARAIATQLSSLPYTDFGPENVRVKFMPKR